MIQRYSIVLVFSLLTTVVLGQNVEQFTQKEGLKNFFKDFKQGDPFKITGNLGLNTRSYFASGIENRQSPFIWFLNGQVNIKVYRLNIPFSALATAQNLTYAHPFHTNAYTSRFTRIGASPYYKWAKLHLGHRAMNFSSLSVANHMFLGAGTELNPGKWRLGGFYGRMARTEPLDLSLLEPNRVVFDRTGWGAKVGYGTSTNFLDLIVFKAKDGTPSLLPTNLDSAKVFQNENMVTALNGQATVLKRLRLGLEISSSAFSKNAQDPVVSERHLIHPSFVMQQRTSTVYRYALNTTAQYQFEVFSLGLNYRRIEPEFRSLGAYFFNDDLENMTANTGFGLFKNKVRVNGSGGIQRNNLRGTRATRFNRTIGSLDINYAVKSFNIGLNHSNYTSKIDYVLNLDLDSLNAVVITRQTALNGSYTLTGKSKNRHTFSANIALEGVTDDVQEVDLSAASSMFTTGLNYTLSTAEDRWRINGRLNYNENELSNLRVQRYGAGGGVQREVIPKKWSVGFDLNYFNSIGENIDNQTINGRFNSPLTINKHHRLDVSLMYLYRFKTNAGSQSPNFRETTGMLNYIYSF